MSEEIVFYHNPMSRGRVIHWLLEELGAPYRIELLSFDKGDHKKPAFLAVNPMGKIPAIVHRGTVVTECGAIITYLADAYPAANLAPAYDDPARATYLRWMFFGQGCVEPALIDRMLSRPPVEKTGAVGYGTYEDVMQTLEKVLTPGPYILGNHFSAVDLYIGSQLGFGMMTKTLAPQPLFQNYVGQLHQRPAYQRAIEQGEKLAAQLKG
jgi:glutathione S-transferase